MQSEFYVAVFLPLFLMYMLVIIRMIERRRLTHGDRYSAGFLPLRDAILVTLALDIAEIAEGIGFLFIPNKISMQQVIALCLLVLHLSFFLLAQSRINSKSQDSELSRLMERGSTNSLLEAYLALVMLMTNATTIVILTQYFGRAL